MVVNSIGNPPASRTPSLARLASRSSGRLHGVTSFHDEATPTWGLSQSSSVIPTARSIARAGGRLQPSVTSCERSLRVRSAMGGTLPVAAPGGGPAESSRPVAGLP